MRLIPTVRGAAGALLTVSEGTPCGAESKKAQKNGASQRMPRLRPPAWGGFSWAARLGRLFMGRPLGAAFHGLESDRSGLEPAAASETAVATVTATAAVVASAAATTAATLKTAATATAAAFKTAAATATRAACFAGPGFVHC